MVDGVTVPAPAAVDDLCGRLSLMAYMIFAGLGSVVRSKAALAFNSPQMDAVFPLA